MQPRNCRRCGRLFLSAGPVVCPGCLAAEEEEFDRVRSYLLEHPGANLDQVARGTGLSPATVLRYLQQGRLQAAGSREEAGGREDAAPDPGRFHHLLDFLRDGDSADRG